MNNMKTNLSSCCNAEVSEIKTKHEKDFYCLKCGYPCNLASPELKQCPKCLCMKHFEGEVCARCASPEVIEKWGYSDFVQRYVNDHNGKARWLRGIFYDEQEKLDTVLEYIKNMENLLSTQEKETKLKIGLLRQWLNEMPDNFRPLTNEDLEAFLIKDNQ